MAILAGGRVRLAVGTGVDGAGAGWWAGRMAGPAGFIGREDELSALLGALGGGTRVVLVVGDAGVGKTRFVAEAMDLAGAAGMVMVRGECLPLADALPMLPVADALGQLVWLEGGRLLAPVLETAPGYVRAEVARLLPALGGGGTPVPEAQHGAWSRGRLFSAVADLLGTVAARSGSRVALVIEDVHWADSETLDCLMFLARAGREGPVTMVVTYRGDEAPLASHVADWLAQARAWAGMQEIRLRPLARDQAARQVAALAGGPVPPRVTDQLYARSEGNPFFTGAAGGRRPAHRRGRGRYRAGAGCLGGVAGPAGRAAGGAGRPLRRGSAGGPGRAFGGGPAAA